MERGLLIFRRCWVFYHLPLGGTSTVMSGVLFGWWWCAYVFWRRRCFVSILRRLVSTVDAGIGVRAAQAGIEEGPAVDDLIVLTHLHEPAILYTLQQRYNEDVIYTYTGPILLAINPFWRVPL